MSKNIIIKNTIIILISSFLIRGLSLLNRLILTRYLGNEGISLYTLVLPTIMLFLSISSLSLNTSMTKAAAIYRSKKVIKVGVNISIISSSICAIILLLISKTLSNNLLKQPNTYYLIILSIPLIFLTSISSVLRGYLTGLEFINVTASANLFEQISRIIFTIAIFEISISKQNLFYVGVAVIAMSVGELISIIITFLKIRNIKYNNMINVKLVNKSILEISIPNTLSSLISNVTFFLEPIIFTFILTKLNYTSEDILVKYSETTAYAVPLITIFSFLSLGISTVIMPKIAKSNKKAISNMIPNIIIITFLPIILISTILSNYSKELSLLLYNTTIGSDLIRKYVWFFIFFYFITPFNTILQSTNNSKIAFQISLISHIIKIILLISLPFFSSDALILSYLSCNLLTFLLQIIILHKKFSFSFSFKNLFIIFLYIIICNCIILIFDKLHINFIIKILLSSIIYLSIIFLSYKDIINRPSSSYEA